MICVNCKSHFMDGDFVIEEVMENGETLPPVHKECLEPIEYRNALRRKGTRVYTYARPIEPSDYIRWVCQACGRENVGFAKNCGWCGMMRKEGG